MCLTLSNDRDLSLALTDEWAIMQQSERVHTRRRRALATIAIRRIHLSSIIYSVALLYSHFSIFSSIDSLFTSFHFVPSPLIYLHNVSRDGSSQTDHRPFSRCCRRFPRLHAPRTTIEGSFPHWDSLSKMTPERPEPTSILWSHYSDQINNNRSNCSHFQPDFPRDGWFGTGAKRADDTKITPFKVAVPDAVLEVNDYPHLFSTYLPTFS